MSVRKAKERTCLICYHKYEISDTERKKWSDELFVMFLMRNILQIPKSFCERLLATQGNPSQWIYCCPACSKTIRDLKTVFAELTIVQKKYDLLKEKVKLTLEYSKSLSKARCDETEKITEKQFNSADEIRRYIFSGHRGYDTDIIKMEPDARLEIKTENPHIDLFENGLKFGDDNQKNYTEDPEKVYSLSNKKGISKSSEKTRELRKRKNKKMVVDDFESSPAEEIVCGDSDSEWESGNVAEMCEGSVYSSEGEAFPDSKSKIIEKPHVDAAIGKQTPDESEGDSSSNEIDFGSDWSEESEEIDEEEPPKKKRKASSKKSDVNSRDIIYCCSLCDAFFVYVHQLNLHYNNEHGKNYKCGHCESYFANRKEGQEHYKNSHPEETAKLQGLYFHREPEDRNCDLCGKFLKVGTIIKHLNEFHKIPKCVICSKIFANRNSLRNHCRVVHFKELNLEPFECKLCKKIFKTSSDLKYHTTSKHTRDFQFICHICSTGCRSQGYLDKHILRVHTDSKDFACKFCDKRFHSKAQMESHEVGVHTKQFKLYCDFCNKGFQFKTQLDKHVLIFHSNSPKPFVCELCNTSFNSKGHLHVHQRGHHYKELNLEPYQCTECGKIFTSGPAMLQKHITIEHTKDFKFICSECGKPYVTQSDLDKHIRHQHKMEAACLCTECGKAYFTKQALNAHIQRCHTKEFTHKCTICPDRGYSDTWGLNRHMKMKHPEVTLP